MSKSRSWPTASHRLSSAFDRRLSRSQRARPRVGPTSTPVQAPRSERHALGYQRSRKSSGEQLCLLQSGSGECIGPSCRRPRIGQRFHTPKALACRFVGATGSLASRRSRRRTYRAHRSLCRSPQARQSTLLFDVSACRDYQPSCRAATLLRSCRSRPSGCGRHATTGVAAQRSDRPVQGDSDANELAMPVARCAPAGLNFPLMTCWRMPLAIACAIVVISPFML